MPLREIVDGLGVPVRSLSPTEAADHFCWLAAWAGMDRPASSAMTRERLGWELTGPGIIEDLRNMEYHPEQAR